jgi:serine/threonine protein kinase
MRLASPRLSSSTHTHTQTIKHPPYHTTQNNNNNRQQLDSWSVGALAYDVLCGRAPFATHDGISRDDERRAILSDAPAFPSGLSYDAVSFMKQALEKDPQKRPSVGQLLAHPWLDGLVPAPSAAGSVDGGGA